MEESVKEIQNFEDAVVLKTCKQCLQRKDNRKTRLPLS